MILDSSAIIAIHFDEPEAEAFKRAIATAERCLLSAFNYFEACIVLTRRYGLDACAILDRWLDASGVSIVAFDGALARRATDAYAKFGKGFNPANFNMGDCASYALACSENDALLYKGNDFSKSDVRSAELD